MDISGAIGATYTTTNADIGKAIRVVASYTDDNLTLEIETSAATAPVSNINDSPTGSVTIAGGAHRRPDINREQYLGRFERPGSD